MGEPHPPVCGVCLDPPDVPHSLPCSHTFCFLCIAQHLSLRSFCPVCRSGTFGMDALSTACVKKSAVRLPDQVFKRSEANYAQILRRHHVRTDGGVERLEWRFAELIRQMMLEQFRERPAGGQEIAWRVHRKELGIGKKRHKHMDSVFRCLSRLRAKISLLKEKARGNSDDSAGNTPP